MATFYHYTDDERAENIIRSGTIQASLKFMSNEDVHYGNGVYLTTLGPQNSTKKQIAKNNWQNTNASTMRKLKNHFLLVIPDSDIKDTKATGRNIFLFGHRNDLRLHRYKWVLKDFNTGAIIASSKYEIFSIGPALIYRGDHLGDFVMIDEIVNGRPVYMGSANYLFMSSLGSWVVGPHFGQDKCGLAQVSNYSLGPHYKAPWQYASRPNGGWETENTLGHIAYDGIVTKNKLTTLPHPHPLPHAHALPPPHTLPTPITSPLPMPYPVLCHTTSLMPYSPPYPVKELGYSDKNKYNFEVGIIPTKIEN